MGDVILLHPKAKRKRAKPQEPRLYIIAETYTRVGYYDSDAQALAAGKFHLQNIGAPALVELDPTYSAITVEVGRIDELPKQ